MLRNTPKQIIFIDEYREDTPKHELAYRTVVQYIGKFISGGLFRLVFQLRSWAGIRCFRAVAVRRSKRGTQFPDVTHQGFAEDRVYYLTIYENDKKMYSRFTLGCFAAPGPPGLGKLYVTHARFPSSLTYSQRTANEIPHVAEVRSVVEGWWLLTCHISQRNVCLSREIQFSVKFYEIITAGMRYPQRVLTNKSCRWF